MVFVGRDGRVQQSRPFGIDYIKDMIFGFFAFFVFFFRSLFHLDDPNMKGQFGNPNRSNTNGRAFPQAWPRRRMGGFTTGSAPSPPPCAPGGG